MSGSRDAARQDRGGAYAGRADDWGAKVARARAVLAAQPFSAMLGAQLAALTADGVELRLPVSPS